MSLSDSKLQGALFALLAFGLFASHDVFVKFLGGAYSPFQIIFFSVLFSFPLVTIVLMRDEKGGSLRPRHPWWTAARTVAATITALSAFYAFSVLPLAQVYAILFAAPLLITVLAIPMLGEKVGLRRGIAVGIGLLGVIVVLRPGSADLGPGHLAALVAAFTSAFASIVMRKIGREERSVVLMLYPMVANFILMGAAMPFVYEPMPVAHLGAAAVVAGVALCATACLIKAYRTAPAVIVAPMQYSQIIWAAVFGALLFEETIDRPTLIGSVIVILSGIYIVLREDRSEASENQPVLRTRSRPATPTAPRVASFLDKTERGPRTRDTGKDGEDD